MQAFILRQNIERFQNLLKAEIGEAERRTIRVLLAAALREQAILLSSREGFEVEIDPLQAALQRREFRDRFASSSEACLLLDPCKGLNIVDINDAYAAATMADPARIIGKPIFEALPDDPTDPDADGIANLHASLERVFKRQTDDVMSSQRYDMRRPEGGFVTKFWKISNRPILGKDGRLIYFMQSLEDFTVRTTCGPIWPGQGDNRQEPSRCGRQAPA